MVVSEESGSDESQRVIELFGEGDSKTVLGGGTVEKIFFHGLSPKSAITMLQRMAEP